MNNEVISALNPSQIELLQNLIRQFKTLGKRFSESRIPELIERHVKSQPIASQNAALAPNNSAFDQITSESFDAPQPPLTDKPQSVEPPPPPQELQKSSLPPLSWQCFHSLLLYGVAKTVPTDVCISCSSSDLGCFTKGAFLPLVPTLPSSFYLRETLINVRSTDSKLKHSLYANFDLQRNMRGSFIRNWLDLRGKNAFDSFLLVNIDMAVMDCINYNQHTRNKIIKRRWDKEDRRRKDIAEKKRKIISDYQKCLMEHRENFLKFHKANRGETAKYAKNAKLAVETLDLKRQRDEARAEQKRLQALKENDMEAYASLVQDTKNGRLKFLLAETENYISTINKLVQQQREGADANVEENRTSLCEALEVGDKASKAVKEYVRSTHRTNEHVLQPKMLKGGDLKEYQLAGLQWLVSLYNNNLNGILADEMGLGKTIQTISLLSYLMEFKNNMGPFLIVVPLSTMSNWANEFNKWAPDIIKVLYKGNPEERRRIFKEDVESLSLNVLITTYEYIMRDKTNLKRIFWQYIIVDEGHRMKNADSKFAQTLGTIYQSKHRILLTGTPLQNNLPELWALLNFLLPKIFSSMETFDQWFNKPFVAFRNQTNSSEENTDDSNTLTQEERLLVIHRLHEVLRPFVLRRVKDQVLDQLPEKVEKVLRCSLSGWQRHMYSSVSSRLLNAKDGVGLNNPVMQLRKICNHPYLFLTDYMIDEAIVRISGKFELLDRMLPKLQAAGHRVLMFSQMVEAMKCLESYFQMRQFNYLTLDGSTPADEREKRMFAFNDPNSPFFIFLLSTRAGGLGLNLATADTVIIFDSDWNPMADAQAQDRAHRIGQKNEVRVFRLTTNAPIEEKILARANDKKNLTGLVVEAGTFNTASTENVEGNKEMMESLLNEWILNGSQALNDTKELADDSEIPDDDQINEMMATYDGELELYRTMDDARKNNAGNQGLMDHSERPNWLCRERCLPRLSWLFFSDDVKSVRNPEGNVETELDFSESRSRKRKDVCYNDNLTDIQFMKRIERVQDEDEATKKLKKRPRSDVEGALLECLDEVHKGNNSILFREKPSKQKYPDYYVEIENPIALKDIINKIKQNKYSYFEEIELDFAMMSHNARLYNGSESEVFLQAELVRRHFYKSVREKLSVTGSTFSMPALPDGSYFVRNERSFHSKLSEMGVPAKRVKTM